MKKNCMNCTLREVCIDMATGKEYSRCSLDKTMRVNRRMCCEMWSDQVTVKFDKRHVITKVVDVPRNVQTLIKM